MVGGLSSPKRPSSAFIGMLVAITLGVIIAGWYRHRYPPLADLIRDGAAALEADDLPRARLLADQIIARAPDTADGWGLAARAALRGGDWDTTERSLRELERLQQGDAVTLWVELGAAQMKAFQARRAEQSLRSALRLDGAQAGAWRLLAQLLSVQGRTRETKECLIVLIRLDAFTQDDLIFLASRHALLIDMGRIVNLLQTDPDNLLPRLALARLAINENRLDDALRELRQIVARHPDSGEAQGLLGSLLADRDEKEFLRWNDDVPSPCGHEPAVWLARGMWLKARGEPAVAIRCFRQAVLADPTDVAANLQLGQALQALGEPALAAAFLERGRRLQEIHDYVQRTDEQKTLQWADELITDLELTGRFWEAWGWSRIVADDRPTDQGALAAVARLHGRLTPDVPQTRTDVIPGQDVDWDRFPLPDWQRYAGLPADDDRPASMSVLRFRDEASTLGMHFHYVDGDNDAPGRAIVSTTGGGVGALDYDRDGWCDVYLTQGGATPATEIQDQFDALYRNAGGSALREVSAKATVFENGYSQGLAAGDVDSDGFPDLYIANLGRNRLLRNQGDGTFVDATEASGLTASDWTVSCAIADFDQDSHPELFAVNYLQGERILNLICSDEEGRPRVCRPTLYARAPDRIARNLGDGRFVETCRDAGLDLPRGAGLGLVVFDCDGDRRLDVFVGNDGEPNYLLMSRPRPERTLFFEDEAVQRSVAFDRDGLAQACMGIAAGDVNRDGLADFLVTNFAQESNTLYLTVGEGLYADMTREAGLREASFAMLGFGAQFLDADLDGVLDLLILNGHIDDLARPYQMRPQLFHGNAGTRFLEVDASAGGTFFDEPRLGRGLCVLDWNGDGRPDFAASFLDGEAVLGTNVSEAVGHFLQLQLIGQSSSRDAVGARVRVVLESGLTHVLQLTAGDGYAACNERILQLGLAGEMAVDSLEIDWPGGAVQRFGRLAADARYIVVEGATRPWRCGTTAPRP